MKKYDIFISYSRKDFDEVNAIVEMLKNHIPTLTCWFDITGIESGDEFEEKIITAIDNSSYVLFALSDNSIQSIWTKKEVTYAQNTETKVIPLLLKGAKLKGWFLFNFGRIDCIDTTNSLQMEKLIKNLVDWTGKASVKSSDSSSSIRSNKASGSNAKDEIKKDNVQASSSNIQTFYYSNGKKQYEGEVKNSKRHGQGTYYFADGRKYEGQWKEDKKHGTGTFYWPDGDKYVGQWKNDKRNGQGTYYTSIGSKYVGEWKDNKENGVGTFYFHHGDKYVGQYADGYRHGQGTYYYADGRQEIRTYKNGVLIENPSKKS